VTILAIFQYSIDGPFPECSDAARRRSLSNNGHTGVGLCGAIDDVVLGNLTGLLERVRVAVPVTMFDGEKSSKNANYFDAVARTNVVLALSEIRRRSPVLEDPEAKGSLKIGGAMYLANSETNLCGSQSLERQLPIR
jgi:carbonic anhydrase